MHWVGPMDVPQIRTSRDMLNVVTKGLQIFYNDRQRSPFLFYAMASAVWSVSDWIWFEHVRTERMYSKQKAFEQSVIDDSAELAVARYYAVFFKHATDHDPSGMRAIPQVELKTNTVIGDIGPGPTGAGPAGALDEQLVVTVTLTDGRQVNVDQLFDHAIQYWDALLRRYEDIG